MDWIDATSATERDLAGIASVLEAVRVADAPHECPRTRTKVRADLTHGWDGDLPRVVLERDDDGRPVGVVQVTMFGWDNRHSGYVDVAVDPSARRRGIGRRLFEAGVDTMREAGRTHVLAESWDTPTARDFAKALGLERAADEVKRSQQLRTLDSGSLAAERAAAQQHAAGYELLRLPGPVPDSLLDAVVTMTAAINDAPTDDLQIEDEVFSPERIRAFEAGQQAHLQRCYRLVARHRESGALAGHTVVSVDSEQPWHGMQLDTSVLRDHRGHRLGLLLKSSMLDWLAVDEPQLRTIETWNAASNKHMVGVNEQLGYEIVAHAVEWQRRI